MVYYDVKNCSESRQRFSATSQIMDYGRSTWREIATVVSLTFTI